MKWGYATGALAESSCKKRHFAGRVFAYQPITRWATARAASHSLRYVMGIIPPVGRGMHGRQYFICM